MLTKTKIVVVDDNEDLLGIIIEFLNNYNLNVIGLNGITHIRQITELSPDLVILDLEMHALNGNQILKMMRYIPEYENIPVIIITALKEKATEDTLKLAQDLFVKPFIFNDLLNRILHLTSLKKN
ncbi:MAG: response regulator [Bacillota bacterium]|nr:response regulator [Bacillota bacterium]